MNDAPQPVPAAQSPDNRLHGLYGQRGRVLKALAEREGVGQRCLARFLDVPQSALSVVVNEKFGGLPRGFSRRYMGAVSAIVAADTSLCVRGCGCVKCAGCGHRSARGSRYCGGGACARLVATAGIEKARP